MLLVASGATSRLDNVLYDGLMRWNSRQANPDIVLVAIDDQSLQEIGAWPWARSVHAQIISRLKAAGAKAVAYDVLFVDPALDPAQDAALANAVGQAANVCLPVSIERPGSNGAKFDLRTPVGALAQNARLGHVDLAYDSDGVARRAMLFESEGPRRIPHLMECAREVGLGARLPQPPLPDSRQGRQLKWGQSILIPYARPAEFTTAPAVSVLRGEVPADFFKGKYVLVGATANGLRDRFATPATNHGEAMAGVEVQANLLGALLAGDALRDAGLWLRLAYTALGVVAMMLALAALPPRRALPFAFGLVVLALAFSAITLGAARVWLPPSALILTVMVVFPLWGWRRLEAVSNYMLGELQGFADEPELVPVAQAREAGGDTVARQIQLLHLTIERVRGLRRFAADTLQSLPDPTFVVGLDGLVLFANPAAQLLRGSGEIAGSPLQAANWTDAHGAPLQVFAFDQRTEGWEREVVAPGGKPYLSAIAPYRDAQGRLVAWIVRLTDISELKAAEAQRERIIQLLSHDMRSPQSSILALLQTASAEAVRPDIAAQLAGYARRTLGLAGDFVQLAKATSNALEFELIDLSDVVTEAIDDLWPLARKADVQLIAEGCDEERLVNGERHLLTRALINLIDNAIKYGGPGTKVTCTLAIEADQVVLTLADQGVGMPAEQMDSLFAPFQRLSTGRAMEGVGLGLTLVWEVVSRHHGTIEVASEVGQGAVFTVRLPLAQDPDETA